MAHPGCCNCRAAVHWACAGQAGVAYIAQGQACLQAFDDLLGEGYFHRDIRPSNLLVHDWRGGSKMQVKLVDLASGRKHTEGDPRAQADSLPVHALA